jgi:hypothetical protein
MWFSRLLVTGQITGVLLALAALAFYPPAAGRMLLVPLSAAAAARLAPLAVSGGAALVAAGPLRGSLVVAGERQRISAAFERYAVLILAAPPALCGATLAGARA